MSNAKAGVFCLRLSDGRSLDLPIGANLTAADLPGLHSTPPGGPVARVTTHPTDPSSFGFQNLSNLTWKTKLPNGKSAAVEPGKNVRLLAGTRINFGLVTGEIRLAAPRRQGGEVWLWTGVGAAAILCIGVFAISHKSGHAIPSPPTASEPKLTEVADKSQPSIVTVIMMKNKKESKPYQIGSGFVVGNNRVVTNLHVIQGCQRGVVKFIGRDKADPIIDLIAVDSNNDLALLQIDGAKAPALPLATDTLPHRGEPVCVWGSPEGLEATFSTGIVSGFRNFEGTECLQITAPISHGNSGGPVLNTSGEVIAVTVGTLTEGQNINFAVPVRYIRKLVGSQHE